MDRSLHGSPREKARRGVRAWVREAGRRTGEGVREASPYAILAFLTASAVAPIAAAGLGVPAAFAAALGQLGGMGANYLADVLASTAERIRGGEPSEGEWRAALAETLLPLLEASDERGHHLREEVGTLLREVDAVATALATAASEDEQLRLTLANAFDVLGADIGELRWMLVDARRALDGLRLQVAAESLQLHQRLDGLRQQLVSYSQPRLTAAAADVLPAAKALHATVTGVVPYPGLASFQPEDAEWFRGREQHVAHLLSLLAEQVLGGPPLVLTGVSGVGKSSLLRAGLLPAIAADGLGEEATRWPWLLMTPGSAPVAELRERMRSLLPPSGKAAGADGQGLPDSPAAGGGVDDLVGKAAALGRRPVIVVDQFEELFTQCTDHSERLTFVTLLANAAPALVVIAVRADFYAACTELPPLARMLARGHVVLGPLGADGLRRAITEPAEQAGLIVEPGLTEVLLRDLGVGRTDRAGYEPGALPLLAHALRATWERREGERLTVEAYRAAGGIHHAVAETAERIYLGLDGAGRNRLRVVLLSLVTITESGTVVRRRGERTTVDAAVLQELLRARLATADDETVEIVHEALLTSWPRLAGWLVEAREEILLRQRLASAAADWQTSGEDPDVLLRGARLAAVRDWAADRDDLSEVQRNYLTASSAAAEAAESARRRSTRRLRRLATGLAAALLLAVAGGLFAVDRQADAEARGQEALSRQYAAESLAALEGDELTAMRKALDAWHAAPTVQARSALFSVQMASVVGYLGTEPGGAAAAVNPDGSLIAVGHTDGRIRLWETATLQQRGPDLLSKAGEMVFSLAFSPDGRYLAAGIADKQGLLIWEVSTGRRHQVLPGFGAVEWLPGTTTVLASSSKVATATLSGWDAVTGRRVFDLPTGGLFGFDVAVSPDGTYLAVSGEQSSTVWRISDRQRIVSVPGAVRVAFGDDGVLVTNGPNGPTQTWRLPSGRLIDTLTDKGERGPDPLLVTASNLLFTFGIDQRTHLNMWRLPDGVETRGFVGFTGSPNTAAISADDRVLVVSGEDAPTAVFRRGVKWLSHPDAVVDVATDPATGRLVSVASDGTTHVTDLATRRTVRRDRSDLKPYEMAFGPDGTLAISTTDGKVQVRDPDGRPRATLTAGIAGTEQFPGLVEVAFSPDGSLLAATGQGEPTRDVDDPGRAVLYDTATLRERGVLETGTARADDVVFSRDGATISVIATTTGRNGRPTSAVLRTWRTSDLTPVTEHPVGTRQVVDVALSPDGTQFAVVGVDRHIAIYTNDGAKLVRQFGTHPGSVTGVAFSPDGRTIATSNDNDNTIRLWDTATGTLTAQLTGHLNRINDLTFAAEDTLVTAASDNMAGIWTLDPDKAVQEVCNIVTAVARTRGEAAPTHCPTTSR
jgi:WD40 repeat protein